MSTMPDEPEVAPPIDAPKTEFAGTVVDKIESEAPQPEDAGAYVQGPRLILKRGNLETETVFPFTPPATIGRFDPEIGPIDIDLGSIVEGGYISRKHARIDFEDDVYTITDLASSNGTFVLREDFERVESAPLRDGDEVALGNVRFVFRVSD